MMFSCGENDELRKKRLQDWHPYFALWPRTIYVENGRDICAWMQWIERKGRFSEMVYTADGPYSNWWDWEYRRKP